MRLPPVGCRPCRHLAAFGPSRNNYLGITPPRCILDIDCERRIKGLSGPAQGGLPWRTNTERDTRRGSAAGLVRSYGAGGAGGRLDGGNRGRPERRRGALTAQRPNASAPGADDPALARASRRAHGRGAHPARSAADARGALARRRTRRLRRAAALARTGPRRTRRHSPAPNVCSPPAPSSASRRAQHRPRSMRSTPPRVSPIRAAATAPPS